jgi:hypothetical protein
MLIEFSDVIGAFVKEQIEGIMVIDDQFGFSVRLLFKGGGCVDLYKNEPIETAKLKYNKIVQEFKEEG